MHLAKCYFFINGSAFCSSDTQLQLKFSETQESLLPLPTVLKHFLDTLKETAVCQLEKYMTDLIQFLSKLTEVN